MAFDPNPVTLKMVASGKGRYVYPMLVTWHGVGGLSLAGAVVQPRDKPKDYPLPGGQPFRLTGLRNDANSSSGWLTINEAEYAIWEHSFILQRKVFLTVRVGGVPQELDIKFTYAKLVPADIERLALDAAHAASNSLTRVIYGVWQRLRRVVPPYISAPRHTRRDPRSQEDEQPQSGKGRKAA